MSPITDMLQQGFSTRYEDFIVRSIIQSERKKMEQDKTPVLNFRRGSNFPSLIPFDGLCTYISHKILLLFLFKLHVISSQTWVCPTPRYKLERSNVLPFITAVKNNSRIIPLLNVINHRNPISDPQTSTSIRSFNFESYLLPISAHLVNFRHIIEFHTQNLQIAVVSSFYHLVVCVCYCLEILLQISPSLD